MGTTHLEGLQVAGVPTMGVNNLPLANKYWFVSSLIGSNGFQGNAYDQPFATLAYAAAYSGVGVGDCIVVMEGHAETVIAAGGITLNTVGLSVVGLGSGTYRPTITFGTATTASLLVSAAGTSISNIIGVSGIDLLSQPIDVRAAGCAIGTTAYGYVEWQDPSSSLQAIRQVLTTTAADNSATDLAEDETTTAADNLIINLKVIGITSGGTAPVNSIRLVGCASGLINIDFYGRASTAVVEFITTVCTNIEVYGYMYNSGAAGAKNVVDTQGSSIWFASLYDGTTGQQTIGGSGAGGASAGSVAEQVAVSATAVMATGVGILTVSGGPVQVISLISECVTTNDATASTVQYAATATGLTQQTISAASGSVASATAKATVSLIGTALSTAAVYNAKGTNLGMSPPGGVVLNVGTVDLIMGVGSTTGTWRHIMRYKPLVPGARVA